MELHEYYSEINSRIEKIDFDALWKDFKPLKFALYNDKKCFFDGQYIEKTDDFFALDKDGNVIENVKNNSKITAVVSMVSTRSIPPQRNVCFIRECAE